MAYRINNGVWIENPSTPKMKENSLIIYYSDGRREQKEWMERMHQIVGNGNI
ncbi:hypothetical protein [Psychroflexus sp. MES1-P1E]|uniref:hypothetical protein n=1 Tax=Psychroflexus sp. MES1-P1E TaxID=2058320 RepID=UPI0015E07702|nr:hypothetical protein [Psychroflexus sp. MES1-P1E]